MTMKKEQGAVLVEHNCGDAVSNGYATIGNIIGNFTQEIPRDSPEANVGQRQV